MHDEPSGSVLSHLSVRSIKSLPRRRFAGNWGTPSEHRASVVKAVGSGRLRDPTSGMGQELYRRLPLLPPLCTPGSAVVQGYPSIQLLNPSLDTTLT
jgi:hypothetical protein